MQTFPAKVVYIIDEHSLDPFTGFASWNTMMEELRREGEKILERGPSRSPMSWVLT
ncbi:hypothetical protein [Methanopyrus sp.]